MDASILKYGTAKANRPKSGFNRQADNLSSNLKTKLAPSSHLDTVKKVIILCNDSRHGVKWGGFWLD